MKQKLTFIIVLMLIIFGCSSEKETPEKVISEPAVSAEEVRLVEEAAIEEAAAEAVVEEAEVEPAVEVAVAEAEVEATAAKQESDCQELSDEAEAAYKVDDFQKAVELRLKVVQQKGCDKTLRAKNQYYAGYIYQFKLNDQDKAKEAYQKVIDNYAGSKYAAMAVANLMALGELEGKK